MYLRVIAAHFVGLWDSGCIIRKTKPRLLKVERESR